MSRINKSIRTFMTWINGYSLQTKLFVGFSSIFVVTIFVVGFLFYHNWRQSASQEAIEYSGLYIEQLKKTINTYIEEAERLSSITMSDRKVQQMMEINTKEIRGADLKPYIDYTEEMLFNIYCLKPDIKNIFLGGNNGVLFIEGTRRYFLTDQKNEEAYWFAMAKARMNGSLVYSRHEKDYFSSNDAEDKTISVVRQIKDIEKNDVVGAMRIDLKASWMEDTIRQIISESSMDIVIYKKGEGILFGPYHVLSRAEAEKMIFQAGIDTFEGTKMKSYISKEDLKTLVVDYFDKAEWKIVGILSNSELIKKSGKVKDMTYLIILISLGLVFVLCYLLSIGVTSPLNKLSEKMKQVESGNFDVQINEYYNDEVGSIAKKFNIMVRKIKDLIDKEYSLQIKRREAELMALQAQINPHFLYNTLETLRMKALINGEYEVSDMAKKLSRFYRLNIMGSSEMVSIREELEHVQVYLEIQNIRHDNRFVYIKDFEDSVMSAKVLKLSLQPLVENAIVHGFEPKSGVCTIILKGRRIGEKLTVEVIDNGVGMSDQRLEEIKGSMEKDKHPMSEGLGVSNVHNRIRLRFGEGYGLEIDSKKGSGTRIRMVLPFIHDQEGKSVD